ncbi:MAG: hypothetical protein Q8O19_06585 [Rectinemataceae bacterium]|nr:hypothetical protein [Rectinemataceae bacterium]
MKFGNVLRWFVVLTLTFSGMQAHAYDWPLSGNTVNTTFGTPENGYFLPGIRISSHTENVVAMGGGEYKYSQEARDPSSIMPTPLGTMLSIMHSEGMEAVYACLDRLTTGMQKGKIMPGAMIGTTGITGWAPGKGMLFCVFDNKTARWINPLLILPARINGAAPAIISACLADSVGETVLGKADSIQQGAYTISVEIRDIQGGEDYSGPSAPYEVFLTVDGKEISRKTFDILLWKDGARRLFGREMITRKDVLDKNGRYILADVFLPRGKTTIGITAVNSAGHRKKMEWTVAVR